MNAKNPQTIMMLSKGMRSYFKILIWCKTSFYFLKTPKSVIKTENSHLFVSTWSIFCNISLKNQSILCFKL